MNVLPARLVQSWKDLQANFDALSAFISKGKWIAAPLLAGWAPLANYPPQIRLDGAGQVWGRGIAQATAAHAAFTGFLTLPAGWVPIGTPHELFYPCRATIAGAEINSAISVQTSTSALAGQVVVRQAVNINDWVELSTMHFTANL